MNDLTIEEWIEEYEDFVKMGMSPQEIARSLNTTVDAMEVRVRRFNKKRKS